MRGQKKSGDRKTYCPENKTKLYNKREEEEEKELYKKTRLFWVYIFFTFAENKICSETPKSLSFCADSYFQTFCYKFFHHKASILEINNKLEYYSLKN